MPGNPPPETTGRAGQLSGAAWSIALAFGLLAATGLLLAAGRLGWSHEWSSGVLVELRHWTAGPLGPVAVGVLFLAGAFLGAPQFVLIGASVGLFGPVTGGLYAWAATLFSAALTFGLGRWGGAGALARFGGPGLTRITRLMAENGFKAAFVIRNVPSGPFIMVNMVMGAAKVRVAPFVFGTALGIIPKIVLIALAGGTLNAASRGALGIAAVLAVLGCIIWAGLALRKRADPGSPGAAAPTDQVAPPR